MKMFALEEAYEALRAEVDERFVVWIRSVLQIARMNEHWGEQTMLDLVPWSAWERFEERQLVYQSIESHSKAYELSVREPDGSAASLGTIARRLARLAHGDQVILTSAPRMIDKIATLSPVNLNIHVGRKQLAAMVEEHGFFAIQGLRASFMLHQHDALARVWPGPAPRNVRQARHQLGGAGAERPPPAAGAGVTGIRSGARVLPLLRKE
jgi:hypothetical protein